MHKLVFGLPLTPYCKFQNYFPKNQIVLQMLSKKLSHAFLFAPSAKLWLEAIYNILALYWPHTANHFKKSGKLKRPEMQSKLLVFPGPCYLWLINFQNYFANLGSQKNQILSLVLFERPNFQFRRLYWILTQNLEFSLSIGVKITRKFQF